MEFGCSSLIDYSKRFDTLGIESGDAVRGIIELMNASKKPMKGFDSMRQLVSWAVLSLILVLSGQHVSAQDVSVSELESTFLKNVTQVTSSFVKAGEGYFSPDGKRLMWTSTRADTHTSQLFIADFVLP
jgi:hypothetical protein